MGPFPNRSQDGAADQVKNRKPYCLNIFVAKVSDLSDAVIRKSRVPPRGEPNEERGGILKLSMSTSDEFGVAGFRGHR
jgi:hypothetical protein